MTGFLGLVCLVCPLAFLGFLLLLNVQFAWKLLSGLLAFLSGLSGTDHTVGHENAPNFSADSSKITRISGLVLIVISLFLGVLCIWLL